MRLTVPRVLGMAVVISLVAGVSVAGASTKFDSTEVIQFPGGQLVVTFDEGGQKRFSSVDYELSATAVVTSCQTVGGVTQCAAALSFPTNSVTGLVPDDKGRVAGSLTVAGTPVSGTICTCISHVDYSDITLMNLTSGHVYRLEPISADSP
jgi:hypothetical protein